MGLFKKGSSGRNRDMRLLEYRIESQSFMGHEGADRKGGAIWGAATVRWR